MILKKQTVWLLTMLSLILVLSVYYMTAPEKSPTENLAYVDEESMVENEETAEENSEEAVINIEETTGESMEETDTGEISSIASEDVFTAIRLERDATRERMLENYSNIIASSESSPEVQAKALENKDQLLELEQKESMLETLIRAKGYKDVLVITNEEDDEVKIIVQADELSRAEANEILLMAREQLGDKTVAVGHQPSK